MKCKYRNCDAEFTGRPNKKFCKVQCKRNELKYKQREKKKRIRNASNEYGYFYKKGKYKTQ